MPVPIRGQLELAPSEEEPPPRPLDGVLYHSARVGLLLVLAIAVVLIRVIQGRRPV